MARDAHDLFEKSASLNVQFDTWMQQKKVRQSSLKVYGGMFRRLLAWLEVRQVSLESLDDRLLERFLAERPIGRMSAHRYLLLFSEFFTWLRRRRHEAGTQSNAALKLLLAAPAPTPLLPQCLDEMALQRVQAAIAEWSKASSWKKVRNGALAATLLGAGLRSTEAIMLEIDDVLRGDYPAIRVRAHLPSPERTVVFLEEDLYVALERWLSRRTSLGIAGALVFPADVKGGRLAASTVFRIIGRLAPDCDTLNPAVLRNTYGRLALRRHTPAQVQIWMGHAQRQATLRLQDD